MEQDDRILSEDEVFGRIAELGKDVLADENFQALRAYPQHGHASRYEHVLSVCWYAVWLERRLHLKVDETSLVRGALLHDFFLYDWHDPGSLRVFHAVSHAGEAMETADRYFPLNDKERDIIRHHMFPVNPGIPGSTEAWLVIVSDKLSALMETLRFPWALRISEKSAQVCKKSRN